MSVDFLGKAWIWSCFGLRFLLKILPSDSAEGMSAVVEAPPAGQLHCKLCGLVYNGQAGRVQYNVFVCIPCGSVDRNIRRKLGDWDGLPPWSCEDQQQFFWQMQAERPGKNLHGRQSKLPSWLLWPVLWSTVSPPWWKRRNFLSVSGCKEVGRKLHGPRSLREGIGTICVDVWGDSFAIVCMAGTWSV